MPQRRLHRPSPILALLAAVALPAALVLPSAGGIRVVDGDTVDLGYRVAMVPNRYRLAGFDAPEIKQAGCASERAAGKHAKKALSRALDGQTAELRYLGNREKWSRLLGALRVNGEDIADRAIREGWGRRYAGGRREGWCGESAIVAALQEQTSMPASDALTAEELQALRNMTSLLGGLGSRSTNPGVVRDLIRRGFAEDRLGGPALTGKGLLALGS